MPIAKQSGTAIYFEVHGEGSATPVVLLMGLGTDAHGWERQVSVLAKKRRVLCLDNRGVGRSDKPKGPYTTAQMAGDAAAAMTAAGVERAHVIGLSLGGMIAQEMALRHRERVESLALIATYGAIDEGIEQTFQRGALAAVEGPAPGAVNLPALLAALQDGRVKMNFGAAFAFLMPLCFTPDFLMREAAYLQTFYERSLQYGVSTDGFWGQIAAAATHHTQDRLRQLEVRTVVITGTRDRLIPPHHARRLVEQIPGARLVEIERGTHGLNLEYADALNRALESWLEEVDT